MATAPSGASPRASFFIEMRRGYPVVCDPHCRSRALAIASGIQFFAMSNHSRAACPRWRWIAHCITFDV
jgi:hypothetical protein